MKLATSSGVYQISRRGGAMSRRAPPHLRRAASSPKEGATRYFLNVFSPAERNLVVPDGEGGEEVISTSLIQNAEITLDLHDLPSPKYPPPAGCFTFLVKFLHFYCLIFIYPYLPCIILSTLYLRIHCLCVG